MLLVRACPKRERNVENRTGMLQVLESVKMPDGEIGIVQKQSKSLEVQRAFHIFKIPPRPPVTDVHGP